MTSPLPIWQYIWSNHPAKIRHVPYFNSFKNMVIQLVFHSKMPETISVLLTSVLSYAFRQGTPCLTDAVQHLYGTMHAPSDACDLEEGH